MEAIEFDKQEVIIASSIQKEKKVYLELLRALSMVLIIFNHTGTRGFFLFSIATDSILYPFYLFISIACKIAVPIYWMISGALLLPKEESIKHVYLHRVLRMVLILILFSLFYFVLDTLKSHQHFSRDSISAFLIKLYTNQFASAFWFIYAYIAMMMMLPFFRKMVKAMPKNYFIYLFVLILFFRGILPIIEYLVSTLSIQTGQPISAEIKIYSLNSNVTSNLFTQNALCFISGYYFGYLLEDQSFTKKGALKWLIAGLIAIVISCFMTQYKINLTGLSKENQAQNFYNNLISIPAFAVFYSVRLLFLNHSPSNNLKKIIMSFGGCAFGIMLLEKALREALVFIHDTLAPKIHSLPACIVWVLAVYLCGYLITLCLKRIPGIKKLV